MTSRPNFSWMNSRLKNVRAQLDYPPPPRTIRLKIPENTPKFMTPYFIYTEYKRFWTERKFIYGPKNGQDNYCCLWLPFTNTQRD